MAQVTQLQQNALPGKIRTFSAKPAGAATGGMAGSLSLLGVGFTTDAHPKERCRMTWGKMLQVK